MADNIVVKDGAGAEQTLRTTDTAGVHMPHHNAHVQVMDAPVTALNPLPVTMDFPVSQAVTGTFWQATQPVSGPLTDAQMRASPVDVAAASLPLPTGAATQTTLAAIEGYFKAEDAAAVSGDKGLPLLAMRQVADTTSTDADGDYTLIKIDEEGRVKVATKPASFAIVTSNITANAQTAFCDVSRSSNVMISMVAASLVGHNVTFEGSIDSTTGSDGNWFGIQVVRTNANTIELVTGVLAATPAYAWEASVNGLSFIRVRATAHGSGTATWKFQRGSYATEPIPAAQVSGTQPVSGTVTANIGTGALAAGANAIGDVGLQVRANATGAASIHHIVSAATTNVVQIKATAGRVLGYCLSNTTASWRFVKLHNVASATAGAAVAMTIGIPPNGKAECAVGQGIGFATAISRSIVTGAADADTTATGVADVVGDIFFA
jgi:hypothetical protein